MSPVRQHLGRAVAGLALGFTLSRLGFSDFGEVHRMLTFTDLRLVLVFAGAVAVAMAGFFLFARGKQLPRRAIHKGTVLGGVIFGLGWAINGTCPAVAPAQLGEGRVLALATCSGIALGIWLFSLVRARWLHWDLGSCSDD